MPTTTTFEREFRADHPDLAEALYKGAVEHQILLDMSDALRANGSLSGKQIRYAKSLYATEQGRIEPIADEPEASDAQRRYLRSLCEERGLDYDEMADGLGKWSMSNRINWVQQQEVQDEDQPHAPTGYYAMDVAGTIHFYRIRNVEQGDWAGWTFVERLTGAPGDWQRHRLPQSEGRDIVEVIAEDPAEFARLFGTEVAYCGVCGSPLSNEESREYGIGPVCRQETGW